MIDTRNIQIGDMVRVKTREELVEDGFHVRNGLNGTFNVSDLLGINTTHSKLAGGVYPVKYCDESCIRLDEDISGNNEWLWSPAFLDYANKFADLEMSDAEDISLLFN